MSFLFGRGRARTTTLELPKQAKDQLLKLDVPPGNPTRTEELAKTLGQMKAILQTGPGMSTLASPCINRTDIHPPWIEEADSPNLVKHLIAGIIAEDLLYLLATNIYRLSFESRKDAQVIFTYLFRRRLEPGRPEPDEEEDVEEPEALSHVIRNRPEVLIELCKGYEHKESAISVGNILREVLKCDAAAAIILYDDSTEENPKVKSLSEIQPEYPQSGRGVFWKFFHWIDQGSFEVSADAFQTFRVSYQY